MSILKDKETLDLTQEECDSIIYYTEHLEHKVETLKMACILIGAAMFLAGYAFKTIECHNEHHVRETK